MRFRRLAIPAYGPFTDLELDFSNDKADFHLIHGRNEAGKSSLLRAIRDLLYGIHAQTADNFLHDYKDLRINAEIENRAGQNLAVQRRKGNRNTLLDVEGNALDDDALAPFIGTVNREFFTTMFGLGSAELRQGAHELLQGKGDLGQALFSASLAGTPIHRVLDALDNEARVLFNGRARVGVSIRPALDGYEAALRDSKQAQVKPETWEDTLRELDAARHAKDALDAELQSERGRQDWRQRCLDALPALGRLREVDARLSALAETPALPPGFAEAAEAGRARLAGAERHLAELRQRHDELLDRQKALAPRLDVLARAAEIDALAAGLAVYRQRRETLATDRAEAARMRARMEAGLLELDSRIEVEGIAALRIPLAEQLALRVAAAALLAAERERDATRREHERLATELEKTRQRLDRLPQAEVAALRDAQAASSAAAAVAQTFSAKTTVLANLARRLASQQQLLPGSGADPEKIDALPLPGAARMREFQNRAAELANRGQQLDDAETAIAKRRRELNAKLERLEKRGALPTQAQLDQAREQREHGWQRVLASWKAGAAAADWVGAPLAESYPAAVRQADALADRLREEADAVAQAEELRGQIQENEAAGQEQLDESARLTHARQDWQHEWKALWQDSGLAPGSPAEMLEWREQWLEFRNRYEAWREQRDELQQARHAIVAAETALRPLLESGERSLLELRELAEERLRDADQAVGERRALAVRLAELGQEYEAQVRLRDASDAALAQAQTSWRASRFGAHRPETALSLLQAHLDLVAEYDAWTRLGAALAEQERASEDDEARVRALTEELHIAPVSAEIAVNTLRDALAEARDLRARRGQVEEDLLQVSARLPLVAREATQAGEEMAALLTLAGVLDQPALSGLLAGLAARKTLRAERDSLRSSLHAQARGEDLEGFIARVHGEPVANLAAELEDLNQRIGELEARRVQAIQALARAEDAKAHLESSGANAAEHLQSARHAAARIRLDTARYLRLRLASRFLKTQIETFRERNQGPLLAKAGDYFRRMTGASFSGLGTDYDQDDTPTLVGLKERLKVPVEGMSEGTRDQLYLALRLAAIELHQTRHEPMPLILDDLLITFDDDRSRAILPLLRDLAGRTQVLLFTHHQHLIDLARETLPADALRLHELKGSYT